MLRPLDVAEATVQHDPDFLEPAAADLLLAVLLDEVAWTRPRVRLFGRTVDSPRLSAWYGDAGAVYTYSGLRNEPLPWTDALLGIRARLEDALGLTFNSVLANLYRDGADSMGWHADDEPELGPAPVIASVSLGASRRFVMRHRRKGRHPTFEIVLAHGSLLVMRGDTQRHWRHALPKTRAAVGPRVNLTFRPIVAR